MVLLRCANSCWPIVICSILLRMARLLRRNRIFVLERLIKDDYPLGFDFRHPSKSFERDFGIDINHSLQATLCSYNNESLVKAFLFSINWFLRRSLMYADSQNINLSEERLVAKEIADKIITDLKN